MKNPDFESFCAFVKKELGDIVVEGMYDQKIRAYWLVWNWAAVQGRFDDILWQLEEVGLHPAVYVYETSTGLQQFAVDRTRQFELLYEKSRRNKNLPV